MFYEEHVQIIMCLLQYGAFVSILCSWI